MTKRALPGAKKEQANVHGAHTKAKITFLHLSEPTFTVQLNRAATQTPDTHSSVKCQKLYHPRNRISVIYTPPSHHSDSVLARGMRCWGFESR